MSECTSQLYLGDCVKVMDKISPQSIDLVITSPPYDDLRSYEGSLEWNMDIFHKVADQLKRIIKPGGGIVWIVNDGTIDGSETGTSFRQALYFMEIGFKLHDTMIWQKMSINQQSNRYIPSFEYMFVFCWDHIRTTNLIKDRKNKYAGTRLHGTIRNQDGSLTKRDNSLIEEKGYRTNVWNIPAEKMNKTGHPAVFPVKLIEDHLMSWSLSGDIVLDPFMGSGSTGVACKNLHRNFIGIEKNEKYFAIAEKRIRNTHETLGIL